MSQLRSLDIWALDIQEEDLELLNDLPNLEYLSIGGGYEDQTTLTSKGVLPRLAQLPSLKRVWLDGITLSVKASLLILGLILFILVVVAITFSIHFRSLMSDIQVSNTKAVTSVLENQSSEEGKRLIQLLSHTLTNPLYRLDIDEILNLLKAVKKQASVRYAYVYDHNGQIVHDGTESSEEPFRVVTDEWVQQTLSEGDIVALINDDILHLSAPVMIGSRILGGVSAGLSLEDLNVNIVMIERKILDISRKGKENHYAVFFLISGLLFIVGVVISIFVGRGLARPIVSLSKAARKLGDGDYETNLSVERSDEIRELAVAFRQMADDLNATTISKQRVDNILGSMIDPLFVVGRTGTINIDNDAAEDLLGYTKEELIGRPLAMFLVEGEGAGSLRGDEASRNSLENFDQWFIARNGRKIPVLAASSILCDASGEITETVVVARDMTKRNELESELRQAQKMEAVGQLTAGVAHDFNNLLAVIMSHSEIMQLQVGKDDPSVNSLIRAASRGSDLTKKLLAFSRKQALRPQPIDVHSLITGMTDLLDHGLGKNIEIRIPKPEHLWPAYADPNQLENAILNLAINARDALPKGGRISFGLENFPRLSTLQRITG